MIELYQSGGAGDFTILQDALTQEQRRVVFANTVRLLRARSFSRAAEILESVPFRVVEATNHFNDDFSMLYAVVPLNAYEKLRASIQDKEERRAFAHVAEGLTELGTYIRFIAVELALEEPPRTAVEGGLGLKQSEIHKLVYNYIGVSGGYLADFTYRTHAEFYAELDLDIDPYRYEGTTRERFIKILNESGPRVQARILEGILTRFPAGTTA